MDSTRITELIAALQQAEQHTLEIETQIARLSSELQDARQALEERRNELAAELAPMLGQRKAARGPGGIRLRTPRQTRDPAAKRGGLAAVRELLEVGGDLTLEALEKGMKDRGFPVSNLAAYLSVLVREGFATRPARGVYRKVATS